MNNRREAFESLRQHPWLGKLFAKLSVQDLELAVQFIDDNAHLEKGEFEMAVNRWLLDQKKPRRYRAILELLSCANSMLPTRPPDHKPR